MSRFREHNGFEMNHFESDKSDGIYYNSIPGQRIAVSPSNSDYVDVADSYETDLSQDSNSYVNAMIKNPGDRPTFENLDCEYEDTSTIRKPRQQTMATPEVDKYHGYEDKMLADARNQCRREGLDQRKPFDYEDVPEPTRHAPLPARHAPLPARAPPKISVNEAPTERSRHSKKYGACCVRGLLLWSVLLLMLVIAAAVYISLQQVRFNALEASCNMTVPFKFS